MTWIVEFDVGNEGGFLGKYGLVSETIKTSKFYIYLSDDQGRKFFF